MIADAPRPGDVLNQGIVWDPQSGPGDRYTKKHPVPFGEYIPWRDKVFQSTSGSSRWCSATCSAAPAPSRSRSPASPVGDAICFDIAYDDGLRVQLENGARLLVVQTSNATFIHTDQIAQQFAITRLRAIESRRTVVVAATNGVTGIIDARRQGRRQRRAPHPGGAGRQRRAGLRRHARGAAGSVGRPGGGGRDAGRSSCWGSYAGHGAPSGCRRSRRTSAPGTPA